MHIRNLTINFGERADFKSALMAALLSGEASVVTEAAGEAAQTSADSTPATAQARAAGAPEVTNIPRIGEAWPTGGIYAGIARGLDGEGDGHLVLLDDAPTDDVAWQAAIDWAKSLGDGARLPTRFESALLYANLRDQLDTSRWHWTRSQFSASGAWTQYFNYGGQSNNDKGYEARARAVRRFPV